MLSSNNVRVEVVVASSKAILAATGATQQQVPVRKQEINDAFHPDINDDARGVNAINASCSLFFRLLYRTGTRNSTVHRAFTVHSARMSLYFARSLTAAPTNHNIRTHTSDHSDTHALRI